MSIDSSDKKYRFLEGIREELRYWPYTIHQIDDTLDTSLIEGRGKQLLFQSLNTRMTTVFVGSGVSAAYGRMSWKEWKDEQLRSVTALSKGFLDLSEQALIQMANYELIAGDKPPTAKAKLGLRWLKHRQQVVRHARWEVKHLTDSFLAASSKNGEFPGGEDVPVLFEIAKKLHDLLLRHRRLFLGDINKKHTDPDRDPTTGMTGLEHTYGTYIDRREGADIDNLEHLKHYLISLDTNSISAHSERFKILAGDYFKDASSPAAKMEFHDLAKTLLVDECAHAQKLLFEGFDDGAGTGRYLHTKKADLASTWTPIDEDISSNVKRDIDGLRDRPQHFWALSAYKLTEFKSDLKTLNQQVPSSWTQLLNNIDHRLEKYSYDGAALKAKRVFITPTSRFLVSVLNKLLHAPLERYKMQNRCDPPQSTDFEGRRSILADRFDPLVQLSSNLGITRYLTTNYDFEIERMYEDVGYRRFDTHSATPVDKPDKEQPNHLSFRTNGLGGVMRDMTFSTSTATDLMAFSVDGDKADASIFHLHGRASKQDNIVVTERDYMNMYLRENANREGVDESILMAFAASPILFLGLGMEEADLLRPLRQFISDQDRAIGYQSIVLLPATKDFDSRVKMSSGLYVRYGAHTIFFGSGEVKIRETDTRESIDWLHRITRLIGAISEDVIVHKARIKEVITNISQQIKPPHEQHGNQSVSQTIQGLLSQLSHEKRESVRKGKLEVEEACLDLQLPCGEGLFCVDESISTLERLNKAVGTLAADLSVKDIPQDALAIMLGVTQAQFDNWLCHEKAATGESLAYVNALELQNCWFTTKRKSTRGNTNLHRQTAVDGEVYTGFYIGILTDLLRMSLKFTNPKYSTREPITFGEALRSLSGMTTALNGLNAAILTACLNASLKGLEQEWREWWKDWQQVPPHREARFEQIDAGEIYQPATDRIFMPCRHVRHRVESVITDLSCCRYALAPILGPGETPEEVFGANHRTNVRIFDKFIVDLAHTGQQRRTPVGRLVQTVAASRGQGKGIFFSVLMTRLGLSSYLSAAHPRRCENSSSPFFVSAAFINLSFSPEIASVYDMISRMLLSAVGRLNALVLELANQPENSHDFTPSFLEHYFNPVELDSPDLTGFSTEDIVGFSASQNTLMATLTKSSVEQEKQLRSELEGMQRSKQLISLIQMFSIASVEYARNRPCRLFARPRMLFCINAPELLFDEYHRPKNLEIADLLTAISDRKYRSAPIDFLFVGDLDALGAMWKLNGETELVACTGKNLEPRNFPYHEQPAGTVKERLAERNNIVLRNNVSGMLSSNHHFVYFTESVKPVFFLVDNFLTLAISLFIYRKIKYEAPSITSGTFLYRIHTELWKTRDQLWQQETPPDISGEYIDSRIRMHDATVKFLLEKTDLVPEAEEPPSVYQRGSHSLHDRILVKENIIESYKNSEDSELYRENLDAKDWNELLYVLGGNRFCLTILMAAAEHLVFSKKCIIEGGELANSLLENTLSQLRNGSVMQKEMVVLETVMSVYHSTAITAVPDYDHVLHELLLRNLAVLGCPVSPNILVRLPDIREYFNNTEFKTEEQRADSSFSEKISRRRMVARALCALCERGLVFRLSPHPKLIRLQSVIETMWCNKATISQFKHFLVSHPILAGQDIDSMLKDWADNMPLSFEFIAPTRIADESLLEKLVKEFRDKVDSELRSELEQDDEKDKSLLHAFKAFRSWPAQREYRYALHRQVQSYCFQRLGHLTATPIMANSFAPTLYASAPSRVIRLSKEGYLFLRRLMLGLSQYPDIRHSDAARDLPIFSNDNVITKVQALRAAMSMARTVYSIAAVSRFSDETTGLKIIRKRGYFETYKVRLRWILRKSWAVHEPATRFENPVADQKRINALYLDEIVWLYNEVAVTCLVQGSLLDGIGHARQALFINSKIEGNAPGGRMHNMLSLNLAIMQIERGRLSSAKRRLIEIRNTEKPYNKKVYSLATGYLALISQLTGQHQYAQEEFTLSIEQLRHHGEDRALALMQHHLARLVARENPKRAVRLLKDARELAESGGHEDVRHRILLSEVWVSQLSNPNDIEKTQQDRIKLREIESYARMMGISSLLVDALHAKGNILLTAGDTSTSGRLMTRAMAIARRNDMALRVNTIMTNYALVLIARRRVNSSLRLLDSSLVMAKRSGYSTEVVRIHDAISEAKRNLDDD